ncbi:MAG: divergent PAP2 family protein [Nanoarchaeota archaeon]|nr:divergent PAP2 family protein [Nanoarchaeota archaeon]
MIQELVTNEIVVSVVVASVICQIWKFIDKSIRKRKIDWYALVATGGMPSSHSTFVCSLAVSIGFVEGFLSTLFLLAAGFAVIVVRDAFGVRHAVDTLTKTVNEIIRAKKLGMEEILKITGHTPVQAAVGVLIGIAIPIMFHFAFYYP